MRGGEAQGLDVVGERRLGGNYLKGLDWGKEGPGGYVYRIVSS